MAVRQPRASQIDRLEAQVLDDAGRKRIGRAGQEQGVAVFDPHAKPSPDLGLRRRER